MPYTNDFNNLAPDATQVRMAAEWFMQGGTTVEIRAFDERGGIYSGYFDSPQALTDAVTKSARQWTGTYITLNPVNPDLIARRANRITRISNKTSTTGDKDVVARWHLLIDIDPRRTSGISSTDAEHEAAKQMARDVCQYLTAAGWPKPAVFDSGNGAHLVYCIDEPVDDGGLVKRCLVALDARFSDEKCAVDTGVFNASRITKLAGTDVRKGDSMEDRPHRRAEILDIPEETPPVPHNLLVTVAEHAPVKEERGHSRNRGGRDFDMVAFLSDAGIEVRSKQSWQGGTLYRFQTCPACGESSGNAAAMMWADGGRTAQCFRNSCPLNTERWEWMKETYRDAYRKQWSPPERPAEHSRSAQGSIPAEWGEDVEDVAPLVWHTGDDIAAATPEVIDYLVPPYIISGGVHDLTAKIKAGKTTLMLDLTRAVVEDGAFLGERVNHSGPVVLLTEQGPMSFQDQLHRSGITSPDLHVLYRHDTRALSWDRIVEAAVDRARQVGAVLLVVDTLSGWARFGVDAENDSGAATLAMRPLLDAAAMGLAVLVNRHDRKSGGEIGDSGRGSGAIGGSADVLLHLVRATSDGHENRRMLEYAGRFEAPAKVIIEWDRSRYNLLGNTVDVERNQARLLIPDILPVGDADPMPTKEVIAAVRERITTIGKSTVERGLGELVNAGVIELCPGLGRNKRGNGYRVNRIDDSPSNGTVIHRYNHLSAHVPRSDVPETEGSGEHPPDSIDDSPPSPIGDSSNQLAETPPAAPPAETSRVERRSL